MKYYCNICENEKPFYRSYNGLISEGGESDIYRSFMVNGSNTKNYACDLCGASNIMRFIAIMFDKLNIWQEYIKGKTVLHIEPEQWIFNNIERIQTKNYLRVSLKSAELVPLKYPNNAFDFIICNGVLQTLDNDIETIQEIFRILKTGGNALLQTPYSPVLRNTFKLDWDESFIDFIIKHDSNMESQYQKMYGSKYNRCVYGKDLFTNLEKTGFKLNMKNIEDYISDEDIEKHQLNKSMKLMLFTK